MYTLKVLKGFDHPDGRNFSMGHDCHALDAFEVSELMADYSDCFAPADEVTAEFIKDKDKVKHLSDAVKRKRAEQGLAGNLKVRKQ